MAYHDYAEPAEVSVVTNSTMNTIAGGVTPMSSALPGNYGELTDTPALAGNYGALTDTPAAGLVGNYGALSDTPVPSGPPVMDKDGFPEQMNQRGSAKQSWNVLQAGVKARIIEGSPGNKMDNKKNQEITVDYRLEVLDPKHRMASLLGIMHKKFKEKTDDHTALKVSLFFEWLDLVSQEHPQSVREVLREAYKNKISESIVNNFLTAGVTYVSAPGRTDFRVYIKSGLFYRGNKLMDTRDNSTVFSGKGWAIYVTNPSGQMYAGSHAAGKFHHSSFLSGRPVMSAGEMKVDNGVLKLISAKSGHYEPTQEQFIAGLKELRKRGADLDNAQVIMYKGQEEERIQVNFYLASPGVFKGLSMFKAKLA